MPDDNTTETMSPPDGPCEDCGAPGWECDEPRAAEIEQESVKVILCAACYEIAAGDI